LEVQLLLHMMLGSRSQKQHALSEGESFLGCQIMVALWKCYLHLMWWW